MDSLFFPQLSTGAIAQFPFSKIRFVRTVENVLADGSVIVGADPSSSRLVWDLRFDELSLAETQAFQQFFTACVGPFGAFTFIDPADNMLTFSSDLTNVAWTLSAGIQVTPGARDPFGGTMAFTVTNAGQSAGTIGQTLAVPASYQYCFSVYAMSGASSDVTLSLAGSTTSSSVSFVCGPSWNRIVSAVRLSDTGTALTAAIELQAGQSLQLYGPQLEPQGSASTYRSTSLRSGVYSNSHWASNQLTLIADGPNSFAASFSIESVL